ncbi:MAG TPA: hypothetical protein VHW01_23575 [Polyangiaceae bacterium]|nr:hypothetical protein [Polyangiaceae bacterium]
MASLKLFCALLLGCSNCLLYAILKRKGGSVPACLLGVLCFGLGRLLLLYRLEYPWHEMSRVCTKLLRMTSLSDVLTLPF